MTEGPNHQRPETGVARDREHAPALSAKQLQIIEERTLDGDQAYVIEFLPMLIDAYRRQHGLTRPFSPAPGIDYGDGD